MTTKPDDGGPAFPNGEYQKGTDRLIEGISIRDYFAGQAMIALMSPAWKDSLFKTEGGLAMHCYMVADAMLAARQS